MFSHLTTSRESQTDVVLPSYSKEECGFGRSIFDLFFFLGCALLELDFYDYSGVQQSPMELRIQ